MLTGKKQNTDAEAFWRSREEEIGSPILGKALGRVVQDDKSPPLWGLIYTSAHGVYFQTFKSENWISMLLTRGKGSDQTKDETIEIRREAIIKFEVREKKGGLLKLFKQPPLVELSWSSGETGQNETMLFEMDGDAKGFVSAFVNYDAF